MPSIQDWATKAARQIRAANSVAGGRSVNSDEHVAMIISRHAAPLVALLRESRRSHSRGYHDEACDYRPCPQSREDATDEPCDCGATKWNARIDAALDEAPR